MSLTKKTNVPQQITSSTTCPNTNVVFPKCPLLSCFVPDMPQMFEAPAFPKSPLKGWACKQAAAGSPSYFSRGIAVFVWAAGGASDGVLWNAQRGPAPDVCRRAQGARAPPRPVQPEFGATTRPEDDPTTPYATPWTWQSVSRMMLVRAAATWPKGEGDKRLREIVEPQRHSTACGIQARPRRVGLNAHTACSTKSERREARGKAAQMGSGGGRAAVVRQNGY